MLIRFLISHPALWLVLPSSLPPCGWCCFPPSRLVVGAAFPPVLWLVLLLPCPRVGGGAFQTFFMVVPPSPPPLWCCLLLLLCGGAAFTSWVVVLSPLVFFWWFCLVCSSSFGWCCRSPVFGMKRNEVDVTNFSFGKRKQIKPTSN